ncbi:MAG TPA: gluconate 2-dehydrogenase subunit 3 family protein [Chthoniobacter sp.]|nr:gluconate 2-dehydrogenase subunit 3 family protein [Chthoniobacter sp.]
MNGDEPIFETSTRLPRRTVLKWFAAVAAATQLPDFTSAAPAAGEAAAKGYGMDPDLSKFYAPGDFWPLTFTPAQRDIVTALADLILPADHLGPAASELKVPAYIDEWVSAPYPLQQKDRDAMLPGLQWLDDESKKRFSKGFAALGEAEKRAIADDICWPADAKPEFKKAAAFFTKFRSLAASAYYGTEAGWKAIGYVGNTPLASFDGPPPEVLAKVGVEQTVK